MSAANATADCSHASRPAAAGWMACRRAASLLCLAALAIGARPAAADEAAIATPWTSEYANKARLVAGRVSGPGQPARLVAGVEIRLDDGWKTYWRNPGSSGVPPRLEWTGSENLADAHVLYPAPLRIRDKEGDTFGYKKALVLPVEIRAKDPSAPVVLKLALEYGVCKDVCIPVQSTFELVVPPDAAGKSVGAAVTAALDRVPRETKARQPGDPELKAVTIDVKGDKPHILIDAAFPGDAAAADLFLEAPDGIWIPPAKPLAAVPARPGAAASGTPAGLRRFHVDLTDGADVADLKGRSIRVTLVGSQGTTDTAFTFE